MADADREIRLLVRSFYDVQVCRIHIANRIDMLVRDYDIDEDKADGLHMRILARIYHDEKALEERVRRYVNPLPIFQLWLKDSVMGVSELLAGALFAGIEDISRFDTVSKLWKFCGVGLDLNEDGVWVIQKRHKGQKINYSPFLKTVCWKLGESFMKTGDRGFYGQMYQTYKVREIAKLTKAGVKIRPQAVLAKMPKPVRASGDYMSEGQVHNRAKRKTAKLFLSHLWHVWREIEGLPVSLPWQMVRGEKEEHHYYEPPGWGAENDRGQTDADENPVG